MSAQDDAERAELRELVRSLSPRALGARAARIPELYRGLSSAPLPRKPKALLFDVYGTLLVSAAGGDPLGQLGSSKAAAPAAMNALEAELAQLGYAGGAGAFARAVGLAIERANAARRPAVQHPEVDIEALLGPMLPSASPRLLRRIALMLETALNPSGPMPGLARLVAGLAADGRPSGIVSNAQFYTTIVLEAHAGATDPLPFLPELTLLSYELGVAKPGPDAFARATERLSRWGIAPRETVYLGNSHANDVVPPRSLGYMTVLFAGDERSFRPADGDAAGLPDSVVDSLDAFAELVELG